MSDSDSPRTRVLLSFSHAYVEFAQRIAADLRAAHIDVRYDSWDGGGGVPATPSVMNDVKDVSCVVPILTPSDAASTWIGDEWKRAIYDEAEAAGVPVLSVRGDVEIDAIPAFLKERSSIADLRGSEYPFELRRLVGTIRERSGDATITLPGDREGALAAEPREFDTTPLVVECGTAVAEALEGEGGPAFGSLVPMLLDGLFYSVGVAFPVPVTRLNRELPPFAFRIVIHGVPEFQAEIRPGSALVNERVSGCEQRGWEAVPAVNPATGATCAWIPEQHAVEVRAEGFTTCGAAEFVILSLSEILRRKAPDFIGIEETRAMLASIEPVFPMLVSETVPKTVSLFVLTDVLRRLLADLVCIRDLRRILLAVAEWGRVERDPMMLTEYVRAALRRQLSHWLCRGGNELIVLLLHPDIEASIEGAMKHTPTGSYVELEPAHLRGIVDAIRVPMRLLPDDVAPPPILTTMTIRSSVRRMVASSMPRLHVVSYQDLRPDINVQPVGRISLAGFEARPGVTVGGVPLWPDRVV